MNEDMIDYSTLKCWANELGFAKTGICSAKAFDAERRIVSQQEELKERRQLRFDPNSDDQNIKSLVVLLWPYAPAPMTEGEFVWVDNYYEASNAAYHAARQLESRLIQNGCFAKANVSYPAKAAAVRARLGVIGDHSLLITPEYGTRVVIILMATDIPFSGEDGLETESECLHCGRCARACPVGAIDSHGMRYPQKCLRNYMMEGVVVPSEIRDRMGSRLIGCDACQRACPMQPLQMQQEQDDRRKLALSEFISEDSGQFSAACERLAQRIGRNAARPQRVRAQAALLAGCSRDPSFLPVLRLWADSPFEAVSKHSAWAIQMIEADQRK